MQNKKGISLIVLVITIIIMIILAASVVITLSDTGIIGRAEEVVELSNLNEVQQLAQVAWSEAYIDKLTDKTVDLEERVFDALNANNVKTNNYNIVVTESGVTVSIKTPVPADWKASVREVTEDGVPIPIGFVKSPYENEGTKNGGLVIYALTEDEIKAGKTTITDTHQTALETRNQFVWVPVDSNNFEDLFVRTKLSSTLGSDYWELVLDANNMPSQDTTKNTTDYVSSTTLQEATAMYASVKKYGGFYIARYEVGSNEVYNATIDGKERGYIATRATKDNISNLSITMGKYPYSCVAWGTSMSNEISDDGAVSLARAFYPSTGTVYGVVSTLTYGVQWDRTLNWWKELNPNFNLTNSTSYGVYYDTTIKSEDINPGAKSTPQKSIDSYGTWSIITSKASSSQYLLTTGGYKKANVYNIYDMAGNLSEWTMEGWSTTDRSTRGLNFVNWGSSVGVTYRSNIDYNSFAIQTGFRPSLYIK